VGDGLESNYLLEKREIALGAHHPVEEDLFSQRIGATSVEKEDITPETATDQTVDREVAADPQEGNLTAVHVLAIGQGHDLAEDDPAPDPVPEVLEGAQEVEEAVLATGAPQGTAQGLGLDPDQGVETDPGLIPELLLETMAPPTETTIIKTIKFPLKCFLFSIFRKILKNCKNTFLQLKLFLNHCNKTG